MVRWREWQLACSDVARVNRTAREGMPRHGTRQQAVSRLHAGHAAYFHAIAAVGSPMVMDSSMAKRHSDASLQLLSESAVLVGAYLPVASWPHRPVRVALQSRRGTLHMESTLWRCQGRTCCW